MSTPSPSAPLSRVGLGLVYALAAVTVVNLVSVAAELKWLEWASKPVLMPLLLALVVVDARRLPGWIAMAAALACATVADVALLIPGTTAFLVGMGFFLVMQIAYITVFARAGAVRALRTRVWAPIAFAAFWATFLGVFWTDFDDLAPPIAVYSLALATMATISWGLSTRAGIGGTLFLISDSLIALGMVDLDFAGRSVAIMTTYVAAQYLLVTGWTRSAETR